MEQSIMNRDPELEASFSFSGQDFSPALAAFSDEEDGNDDQYIEIALERPINGDHPDDGSNQLEFCISFSSSVPFLQLPNCGLARADTVDSIGSVDSSVPFLPNCGLARADTVDSTATVDSIGTEFSDAVTTPVSTSSSSTSASTLGFSSADTRRRTREPAAKAQKTIKRRVQFRSVNRLLNSLLSNPAASSEIVNKKDATSDRESCSNHHELVVQSRKGTKITKTTTTTNGGIIMKFLIKCRSINIRPILTSFMKPYQFIYSPNHQPSNTTSSSGRQTEKMKRSPKENNNNNLRTSQSLKKPFDKWLVQRSKAFDINLDAIRGVLEAMSSSLSCRDRKPKNSPSATQSSIQQGYGYPIENNSIQAAIAHCKRSFGQTSEFRFN
ncbi:hypothetical protein Pint_35150 [Pistacia integerrima]|uniref:Uncharacterized protein n=1 Tax=Pistacia integerrima TaxID=434235 RepID=A0ACC0Y2F3_9ROSI|nr:hypothetical protein Pint_35150 [Pistacia integerrima]